MELFYSAISRNLCLGRCISDEFVLETLYRIENIDTFINMQVHILPFQ